MSGDISRLSDRELYNLVRTKNRTWEAAFAEIYTRHNARIYMYCRRIMGNEETANDIFQETFLRFFQGVEKGRDVENIPAYLLRIARNLCFDAKKATPQKVIDFTDLDIPVEDGAVELNELSQLVEMALEVLTEEYKEAFVLQAYNGLSYKEIGVVIGAPISTVRNRVVRAKKKVREVLAPYLEDYRN